MHRIAALSPLLLTKFRDHTSQIVVAAIPGAPAGARASLQCSRAGASDAAFPDRMAAGDCSRMFAAAQMRPVPWPRHQRP